jgi:hypothetical protein
MPAPAWENLDDFLREDDFAFPAVINLQAGGQVSLSGIFDDPSAIGRLGQAHVLEDVRPTFMGREDLMQPARRGDTITITFPAGPQTFDVLTGPQPDGTGMAVMDLARQ